MEKPPEGLVVKASMMWRENLDLKQNELGSGLALSLTNQGTATLGRAPGRQNQENPSRLRATPRFPVAKTTHDSVP